MAGSLYLWFRYSIGFETPLHVFQTVYLPKKLPKKKYKEEEVGWYYFGSWGAHKPFVLDCPSSIKLWKEAWFWVSGNWQRVTLFLRCELKEEELDILREIYGQASEDRRFGKAHSPSEVLDRTRSNGDKRYASSSLVVVFVRGDLTLFSFVAADFEQGKRPTPPLVRLAGARVRELRPGSSEEVHQKKMIDEISHDAAREQAKCVAGAVGADEGEEVAPLTKRLKVVDSTEAHPLKAGCTGSPSILEASIACSIRAASASMRSLNAVKEYKKKMAGEAAKEAEFRGAMDGLTATAESARLPISR
ncbi:Uncharacterized protein Adt_06036 [Abeliophyllum distichum]|uniref:Uncharacterized protein n=1 Tax=Abeliophyllum distichum TaxID=126358 RepID=A0ABD1V7X1_9LAMI